MHEATEGNGLVSCRHPGGRGADEGAAGFCCGGEKGSHSGQKDPGGEPANILNEKTRHAEDGGLREPSLPRGIGGAIDGMLPESLILSGDCVNPATGSGFSTHHAEADQLDGRVVLALRQSRLVPDAGQGCGDESDGPETDHG